MNCNEIIISRWVFELLPNTVKDRVIIKRIEEHCVTISCFDYSMMKYLQEFTMKMQQQRENIELDGLMLYLLKK